MSLENCFKLGDDDAYDKRCCEIFITRKRYLIFHCSLCKGIYGSFATFFKHLQDEHGDEKTTNDYIIDEEKASHYVIQEDGSIEFFLESPVQELATYSDVEDVEGNDHFEVIVDTDDLKMEGEIQSEKNDFEDQVQSTDIIFSMDDASQGIPDIHDSKGYSFQDEKKPFESEEIVSETENFVVSSDNYSCNALTSSEQEGTESQDGSAYFCEQCNQSFYSEQLFQKHNSINHSSDRKFKCEHCGFAFKELFNLRAHVRRHSTQAKRFSCSQCPKKFHTRSEMQVHERRHTGERPFICAECGLMFITSGALSQHIKRHRGNRPHECTICKKRFFDSGQLKDHIAVHTKNRIYSCNVCSSTFSRKKALIVHQKLHENKREYVCNICGASFNQGPALSTHLKKRHRIVKETSE